MTLRTGVSSYSNSDDRTSRLFKKYVNYWYWNLNSKTCFIWIFILVLELHCSLSYKYSPEFNDKLQFDISWRGPVDAEDELLKGKESIIVKTKEKEKYQCILPKVNSQDEDEGNMLGGPSPEELLKNVLLPGAKCSYRLEPYWTYEICHGLHVRQFHEEKDANEAVVATLKYFEYKTVNDVLLPSKKMEKEEFGIELFSKEYIKIKDPNELISKGNLTDSDK